jgi:hypothetical protein
MYLYSTCSISYGVKMHLDLRNVNKFNSIQVSHKCIHFAQKVREHLQDLHIDRKPILKWVLGATLLSVEWIAQDSNN